MVYLLRRKIYMNNEIEKLLLIGQDKGYADGYEDGIKKGIELGRKQILMEIASTYDIKI